MRLLVVAMVVAGCSGQDAPTPNDTTACGELAEECEKSVGCCDSSNVCLARAGEAVATCHPEATACLATADACTDDFDCCGFTCQADACLCATRDNPCDPNSGVNECCEGLSCTEFSRCDDSPTVCKDAGLGCSVPEECCEHLTCVAETCSCGTQSSPCETALDCCEGLVCFPNAGCQFPA